MVNYWVVGATLGRRDQKKNLLNKVFGCLDMKKTAPNIKMQQR